MLTCALLCANLFHQATSRFSRISVYWAYEHNPDSEHSRNTFMTARRTGKSKWKRHLRLDMWATRNWKHGCLVSWQYKTNPGEDAGPDNGYTSLQDRWKLWHQRFTSWRKRTAGCATKISVWEWDQSTHDKISFHEVIVTRRECPAAVSDLPFTVLLDCRCIWRKIARFSSWYFDVECCGWNIRVAMSHSYSAQRIRRKTKS